jgi:LacI family transcriptional regulator
MSAKEAPRLQDVARYAGVSTATVSRCLNSPEQVRPAMRARVDAAVEALGYTPHFGARALASNRTNTVGAIIPTMENAIFARGLQAFQEELAVAGVTLLVASSSYDADREAAQIKALVSRGADGLLLIGAARSKATYDFLRRRQVPYVLAWIYHNDQKHYYAGFDNRRAARKLTEWVIGQGHRRVAMVAGITAGNDRAAGRVKGVQDGIRKAGLKDGHLPLVESAYSFEGGALAFDSIRQQAPDASVIICGNDVLAIGVIRRAKQLGLSVPGDISVVGFDDIDLATLIEPALTTVHVPHRRMGQSAAQLLLKLRDQHQQCQSIAIEPDIIVRESLAPISRR